MQNQLKTVNDYAARLIKTDELSSIGYEWRSTCATCDPTWEKTSNTPSWVYNSDYDYWTMSQYNDSLKKVWYVCYDGELRTQEVNELGVVRPVINLYKSAIQNNS
jgi:hypothetical protein